MSDPFETRDRVFPPVDMAAEDAMKAECEERIAELEAECWAHKSVRDAGQVRIAELEAALVKVRAELLEWTPRYRFIDTALEAIEVVLPARPAP